MSDAQSTVVDEKVRPRARPSLHSFLIFARPWVLLAPCGLFIGILLACTLSFLRLSFGSRTAEWGDWTIANYALAAQPIYLKSFGVTLSLAVVSAVVAVLLAFPVALYMSRVTRPFVRRLLLICVLMPMLVSVLVQSYGWIVLLGPDGVLNRLLRGIGAIDRPVLFLFSGLGVLLGLVQTTVPMAVLPIASALQAVPRSLEEAAAVLGAPRWEVYRQIIVPLSRPGLLAALLLVFGFNVGAFVVPLLLGGLRVTTVPLHIRDQIGPLLNWPFGAALSVLLIVITLATQAVYQAAIAKRIAEEAAND